MKSKPLLVAALLVAAGILAYAGLMLSTDGTPPPIAPATKTFAATDQPSGNGGELSLADIRAAEFEEEVPAMAVESAGRNHQRCQHA
jgi:hypothetical protein